jgi:recombination protein U
LENTKRQIAGRRSKEAGATFERWISAACDYYLRAGIAFIEKTPEPFHITGKDRNGVVRGYYEKKGQPDYKGILCDGTGIMFEAKHTDTGRINQNVITDTQWESLDLYEHFGAHCYVMVSLGLTDFYRVPWEVWKRMKELYGRKYMTGTELEPFRVAYAGYVMRILDGIWLADGSKP